MNYVNWVEVLNNGEENDNNIKMNDKRINLRYQDINSEESDNEDFSRQLNHVDNNSMFDQNSISDENENSILDKNDRSSTFDVNDSRYSVNSSKYECDPCIYQILKNDNSKSNECGKYTSESRHDKTLPQVNSDYSYEVVNNIFHTHVENLYKILYK